MTQDQINALDQLGDWILSKPDELELAKLKSKRENPWFDLNEQQKALNAIASKMLQADAIQNWVSRYDLNIQEPKNIGLILAGNIPAVGFHDVLSVLVSGHAAKVKLSNKDKYLIPALFHKLIELDPASMDKIQFVNRLTNIEAVIATGSNNSNRYFKHYFGHLPHIIRGNRNSIAVIDEHIDADQIKSLGHDVFDYYGLGCRSVSQILVPIDFNENKILDHWEGFSSVIENTKYENNFKYNYATNILNKEEFKTNNFVILKEDERLASRIACIHLKRYSHREEINSYISNHLDEIQLCVSNIELDDIELPVFQPGSSQEPRLTDYADGVDTMEFLKSL